MNDTYEYDAKFPVENVEISTIVRNTERGNPKGHRGATEQAAIVSDNISTPTVEKRSPLDANGSLGHIAGGLASDISVPKRSRFRPSNRKTASKAFRDRITAWKPILGERPDYMRMFVALISPQHTEDGKIVIDAPRIAGVMHKEIEYAWGYMNPNAGDFLDSFSQDVFGGAFKYNQFAKDAIPPRARTVDESHVREIVPADIWAAWEVERETNLRKLEKGGRVYLDKGDLFGSNSRSQERKRLDRLSDYARDHAPVPIAGRLLNYLNKQPAHYFEKKLRERSESAYDAIDALTISERGKEQLRAYMKNNIVEQPRPFYGFSPYSVRLFDVIGHLPSLSAPVRRAFLNDAVEYDLASSQLAIVAVEWEIPELRDFLENGKSIWPDLLAHMEIDYSDEAKAAIKRGVYGLVYGAGRKTIISDMTEEYEALTGSQMDEDQAERLLTHRLMEAVWDAREDQLKAIQTRGFAVDVFGRKITEGKNGFGPDDDLDYSRSILAQVSQARELWLLVPAIELVLEEAEKKRPDFRIVLWQHDGFSLKYRSARRRKTVEPKLKEAVKARAKAYGYPTELETKYDPDEQKRIDRPAAALEVYGCPALGC